MTCLVQAKRSFALQLMLALVATACSATSPGATPASTRVAASPSPAATGTPLAPTPTREPQATDTPLASSCATPLDQETLDGLVMSLQGGFQLQPGDVHTFILGVRECCVFFNPVEACATWSVAPPAGASMDSHAGVLRLAPDVPPGSRFVVSADVEGGRRMVTTTVFVYTPESNPLAGAIWSEQAQIDCATGGEVVPDEPLQELIFRADSFFTVTWHPFEVYVDYGGTFTFDLERYTLAFADLGGNYVPEGLDTSGSFAFDENGNLLLTDMWLGQSSTQSGPARCGHRFSR